MRKEKTKTAAIAVLLSLTLLTGCTGVDQSGNAANTSGSTEEASTTSASIIAAATGTVDVRFDSDDYYFNWKNSSHTTLDMSSGSQTVTKSGIYEITGTLPDGCLTVDIDKSVDEGTVYLVLNNVSITSSASAPIYVKDAEKVVLLLEDTTSNTVWQGSSVIADSDNEPSSAIFSRADLTITGGGTLNVVSDYNDGITSKDTLKITDGTLVIDSKNDGIVGKDLLAIEKCSITITAGKDGMRSTNDTDAGLGNILINGGDFMIQAGDDGIHADSSVVINGGTITIQNAYEGIEGKNITIGNGDISVTSSDDGFNVNDGAGLLTIGGGTIYLNSGGDGLDANGSIGMTGGTVYVDGPTNDGNGAIDYQTGFTLSGGTMIATGSSGMAQTGDTNSNQPSILMYYSAAQAAGTAVTVKDESGNTVASFTPAKLYASAAISTPGFTIGKTYTLYSGETQVVTFTLSDTVTYLNEAGITTNQGMGPGGQMGGFSAGGKPDGQFHGGGPMGGVKPGA